MTLRLKDIRFIRQSMSGEMLTYLSYAALEKLKPGREQAHYEYLMELDTRLGQAEKEAQEREAA